MKQIILNKFYEIAPDVQTFTQKIKEKNFFSTFVNLSDENLSFLYGVLNNGYKNSFIRYFDEDDFYSDLVLKIVDIFPKYSKIFKEIKNIMDGNDDLLSDSNEKSSTTRNVQNDGQNYLKTANTPATIGAPPDEDFVDKYTDSASKTQNSSTGKEDSTYQITRSGNKVDALNRVLDLTDFKIKDFVLEFADLFLQVF